MALFHNKKCGLVMGKIIFLKNGSVRYLHDQSFPVFLQINVGNTVLANSVG